MGTASLDGGGSELNAKSSCGGIVIIVGSDRGGASESFGGGNDSIPKSDSSNVSMARSTSMPHFSCSLPPSASGAKMRSSAPAVRARA